MKFVNKLRNKSFFVFLQRFFKLASKLSQPARRKRNKSGWGSNPCRLGQHDRTSTRLEAAADLGGSSFVRYGTSDEHDNASGDHQRCDGAHVLRPGTHLWFIAVAKISAVGKSSQPRRKLCCYSTAAATTTGFANGNSEHLHVASLEVEQPHSTWLHEPAGLAASVRASVP